MRVIFFGTPSFGAETLKFLLQNKIDVVAVVTKPDRPQGRSRQPVPTAVKEIVLAHQPTIPLFQPEIVSDKEFAPQLAAYNADIFVVVAYGEILKQHLLEMPRLACINVHPSLLPKFRGATPIQQAILEGEKVTGVSVMHMAKKMDAGDIIKSVTLPLDENISHGELEKELCAAGCQILLEVLQEYASGKTPPRHVQDESKVSFSKKIELEECQIDWQKPAQFIHNLIRAVNPEPGAWCIVNIKDESKRLKIKKSRVVSGMNAVPGTIVSYGKEGFIVACGENALEILELQLEGKKVMQSQEFTRGFQVSFIS